jgi:tetratricopeptide (TPR) repeat protein
MRKIIAFVLLLGCLVIQPAVAETITDSFSFLQDIPLFSLFMEEAKNTGDFEQAKQLRSELLALPLESLSATERTVLEIRTDTVLARLCTELDPKQIPYAKELLSESEDKANRLPEKSLFSYCAFADINGIWYLISSANLSKGIASSKQIGKAYNSFPHESAVTLLKANSMLFTPSFSQNNIKEALNLFLNLLQQKDVSLAKWDLASLYSGIGIACFKLGDFDNASGYLRAAKALYSFDHTLDEYLAKLEKNT